ncbi:unnamed protein product [Rotaria socialis]|uniref:Uncharacterized protein n=1 Tax=Rotaria socialis TaxID=392032 RepID=A0A821PT24_9BILA|nr:unnamed protein product [Rotaria socialis]
MSSTNGSNRPPSGFVSIPVEIIREPKPAGSDSHSRHNSPFRTLYNDNVYTGFSDPHSWGSNSPSRFQTRPGLNPTTFDRPMPSSQFNQPFNDFNSYQTHQEPQFYQQPQQRIYEPGSSHFRRSSEDLLSSPFDSNRFTTLPQYTSFIPSTFGSAFRTDSDFVQPNKFSNNFRRSFDALNDFADMHQSFPMSQQYPFEQQQSQLQPQPQSQPQLQPQLQPQQQQQQQQQQPYYRSTFQTQYQPQPQQPQQPTYANQAYINPNIIYTNEYGTPMDHYQSNTSQGNGNNSCK